MTVERVNKCFHVTAGTYWHGNIKSRQSMVKG